MPEERPRAPHVARVRVSWSGNGTCWGTSGGARAGPTGAHAEAGEHARGGGAGGAHAGAGVVSWI